MGTHNLYLRGKTWWIKYCVGGRTIRRSLRTQKLAEAKKLRDQVLAKRAVAVRFGLEESTALPCETFGIIARRWLTAREASNELAPSTISSDRFIVERHLIPEFGAMTMSAISVEDVETFLSRMRSKFGRSTVANYYNRLRGIYKVALRRGWYSGTCPLDRLERQPSMGPGREVALTVDEADRLLHQLNGPLYYKVALALYTGLRWGEIHGLAWSNLDLDSDVATLTVERSFRGPPKNEASAATVPISQEAAALMRCWRAEQKPSIWVFPNRSGQLPAQRVKSEDSAICKAAKNAGIDKHVTPHVFRHTFGTWLFESTGDAKMVQRLMRHASFHTSMRYVHDRRELAPVVNTLPKLGMHRRQLPPAASPLGSGWSALAVVREQKKPVGEALVSHLDALVHTHQRAHLG